MKKIITLFTLLLAFSFNSNAQEKSKVKVVQTETKEDLAKRNLTKDVEELFATVTMNESLKHDLTMLIEMRAQAVFETENQQDKKAIFDRFTSKIVGGLNAEQLLQLKKNDVLYKRLTEFKNN
jgi:hypothetical protein